MLLRFDLRRSTTDSESEFHTRQNDTLLLSYLGTGRCGRNSYIMTVNNPQASENES
jgi:hypothetical protein